MTLHAVKSITTQKRRYVEIEWSGGLQTLGTFPRHHNHGAVIQTRTAALFSIDERFLALLAMTN